MKKNILIIGGAGYIGSHIVRRLLTEPTLRKEYSPVVVDNLRTGNRDSIPIQVPFFAEPFLLNERYLHTILDRYPCDHVIFLAARAYVGESMKDPMSYYKTNVIETLSAIEQLLWRVKTIVFASSCSVYGNLGGALCEQRATVPVSPYAETKLIAEKFLKSLTALNSTSRNTTCLRLFNVAGADNSEDMPMIGEHHLPETHLIPNIIQSAIKGVPVKVFGTDYETPDGTCRRDYVHVNDVARAFTNALNLEKFHAINIGSGRSYSVLEVIRAVEDEMGVKIDIDYQPASAGDVPHCLADNTLAKSLLDWTPHLSSLRNIVGSAVRWHVNKPKGYSK